MWGAEGVLVVLCGESGSESVSYLRRWVGSWWLVLVAVVFNVSLAGVGLAWHGRGLGPEEPIWRDPETGSLFAEAGDWLGWSRCASLVIMKEDIRVNRVKWPSVRSGAWKPSEARGFRERVMGGWRWSVVWAPGEARGEAAAKTLSRETRGGLVWPWLLWCEVRGASINTKYSGEPRALGVEVCGFVVTTVGWWVVVRVIAAGISATRAWNLRRRGMCVRCGYLVLDLTRCPECGGVANSK